MINSEVLCFIGVGLILLSASFYGQWYWMNKNLKKDPIVSKIEQKIKLSIWETLKWYSVIGLTKVPLVIGILLLIIGCVTKFLTEK